MRHRKNIIRMIAAITLIVIVFTFSTVNIYAIGQPDYNVDSYEIIVSVNYDGSATVTENLFYDFNEDKSSIDFFVNLDRTARLGEIQVLISDKNPEPVLEFNQNEDDFLMMQNMLLADSDAAIATPMTYTQTDQEDASRLRLHAFFEKDTTRRVVINYNLTELVRRSEDTAFIKQRLVGLPDNIEISKLNIKYVFPYQPNEDSRFDVISNLQSQKDALKVDQWQLEWSDIESGQDLEVSILMPSEHFSQVAVSNDLPLRDELIESIEGKIDDVEMRRSLLNSVRALIFFFLILAIIFLLLIYFIFDREGMSGFKEKYLLPEKIDYPPAVMSLLMRNSKPGILIMCTLIDLVRRNELELEGLVFTWKYPERNDYSGFKAYEIFLLQWFFDRVSSKQHTLSTVQIKEYARDRKTSDEFREYYDQFKQLIDEELPLYGLFDEQKSRYGKVIGISLSALYLILGVVTSIVLMSFIGLLLLVPAVIFFIYGLSLRHLSPKGNYEYSRGNAIKRYLSSFYDIDNLTEILMPDCKNLIDILPYAIALDRTKLFMRQVIQLVKGKDICSQEFICAYQSVSNKAKLNNKSKDSPAAKAASAEQIRLLGRDLVAMESMLIASFYLSSSFHLIEDHL